MPASPPQFAGGLCWHDNSGLVDHADPIGVVRFTLKRVRELLDASLHERDWPERMAEYETYWAVRSRDGVFILAPVVRVATPLVSGPLEHSFAPGAWKNAEGLLVPVEPTDVPFPPERMSLQWVRRELLPKVPPAARRQLFSFLGQRFIPFVVFQVPRRNGLPLLLGLRFKKTRSGKHPFVERVRSCGVRPVRAYNFDVDYLRNRGGASVELKSKTVAVVGCGSVGGQVALDLARSGVGTLILIDPDWLKPENAFRHVLGLGIPWGSKVEQLAVGMKLAIPGIEVRPVRSSVESVLNSPQLKQVDAIVVAVDRPASVQAVNSAARAASVPTVVTSWLEAYGIASHVIRSHPDNTGCFECLVRSPDNGRLVDNRAHLAGSGQDFTKDQAGCGGRYVEFGAVHATRTALLAVEETLLGLRGDREGGLTSWRGDFAAFDAAGFVRSARSSQWPERQTIWRLRSQEITSSRCPVCR